MKHAFVAQARSTIIWAIEDIRILFFQILNIHAFAFDQESTHSHTGGVLGNRLMRGNGIYSPASIQYPGDYRVISGAVVYIDGTGINLSVT